MGGQKNTTQSELAGILFKGDYTTFEDIFRSPLELVGYTSNDFYIVVTDA